MRPGNVKGVSLSSPSRSPFSLWSWAHRMTHRVSELRHTDTHGPTAMSLSRTVTTMDEMHTFLLVSLPRTSTRRYNGLLNHWYIKPYPIPRAHYNLMAWLSILSVSLISLTHSACVSLSHWYILIKKTLSLELELQNWWFNTYDSQTSTHLSPLVCSLIKYLGKFEYASRCQYEFSTLCSV